MMTLAASMERIQPSSQAASSRMARVRQTGTKAEIALRRELHRMGLRYRVNFQVLLKPRRIADVVFPKLKIAIFVDGCFWHGCPEHSTWPKRNAEFWKQKIEANQARDTDTDKKLREIGWTVLRFWEHELPVAAAITVKSVIDAIKSRRQQSSGQQDNIELKPDGTHE